MKKGNILFQINLPFQSKLFKPLSELGSNKYDGLKKTYVWTFSIKHIKKVLAILGKPVVFGGVEAELVNNYSEERPKQIIQKKQYGVGFVHVTKEPTHFVVTTVREKQPQNTKVSFETVKALWKVLKNQPYDKKVLTATVAKNYCKELGIVDFNTYKRESGDNFNWKYFSGSRKHYLVFYSALKVLVYYNVAEHVVKASKSGVKRIAENWELQLELGE